MRPDARWRDRFHYLFPHPFMSFTLGVSWLMLMHSVDAAHLLLALLVAIIFPKLTQFFIQPAEPLHWPTVFRLFFVVLWDIMVANIRVAIQVVGPLHKLHPKWILVPLETSHPKVNTLLALIITTTPGTVSAGLDEDQSNILVHALSTDDREAVIEEIKQRYEQPLIKIFNVQPTSETGSAAVAGQSPKVNSVQQSPMEEQHHDH